jgi:hypothetical protein
MAMPPCQHGHEEAEVSDRPEDVDAAFARIAADLQREGVGTDVRGSIGRDEPADDRPEPTGERPPVAGQGPTWRGHDAEWDWSWGTDEEHYVPPEPPPLPRLRPMTITALVLVAAGVILLMAMATGIVGLDARVGMPVSLAALVCGFGMLFLRLRRSPSDSDGDNGAQV